MSDGKDETVSITTFKNVSSLCLDNSEKLKISAIMWMFVSIWVICAKPPFLHSLNVLIKIFTNSLAVLNQHTLGKNNIFIAFKHSCLTVVWLFGSG